jgi:Amt family ammonium transporter
LAKKTKGWGQGKRTSFERARIAWEIDSLNLPQNSDSAEQRAILDALPVLVFLERDGRVVFANAEARQLLGVADSDWVSRPSEEFLWGISSGTAEPQTLVACSSLGSPFHATLPSAAGQLVPVEGIRNILNREPLEAVIVAQAKGRSEPPKLNLMEDVLSSVPEALLIVYCGRVLYTNPAFTRMFGYSADEATEGHLWELIVPKGRQHEHAMLEMTVDQNGLARIETVRVGKTGNQMDVSILAGPLLVEGAKAGYVLSFRDIAERKQKEARLQHDALHDVLTGLPNRALFLDRLTVALNRRLRRRDQNCGVLFLDLDRFKDLNDTQGHAAGDALLIAVSQRLRGALRPQDSAARLGGDEFALLVENISHLSDLDIVASRVSREMQRPFEILGRTFQAGASIGVAMAGADHTRPELLIRDADFAMYRAKQKGGGRYEIFDKHLESDVTSQRDVERELREVLEKRQFELWYEPICRLQDGKIEGFESLLRWRREDGAVASFSDLLPVAEDTGLSISIGREILESVCRQLRNWTDEVPNRDLTLTVNVTQRQFYHVSMVPQLKAALLVSGADPSRLLLEVSETTVNEDPDTARAILQRLVDCNVRIALDDFGSALAPINHLVRLPIHVLKLAPRLTLISDSTGRELSMLESLIRLGRSLGMQVVAQGVQTSGQLDALCRMGCDLGQGDLFSAALEPEQAIRHSIPCPPVSAPRA